MSEQSTAVSTIEDQVLDAARGCILEYGVRRTTLAEIARRAQVSRPTVYRRWADTRAVVSSLLTREIGSVIPTFGVDGSVRAQISSATADVANSIRTHPLFVKILESDPDILSTYILHRLGASQSAIIDTLAPMLSLGQQDSSIRDGDPMQMACVVLLMVQSAVQSANMVSARISGDDLVAEIAYAVDAYLRPPVRC
ncbi:MAG: helix-turn-helix domain-containing protein [Rhodococcus sp. (in: high G+C Gram-positive bacteria)]|uniref:TetR/AcrR family transcriptional regulator n=1 Tax=Rhodococcus sp. EPR-157 TaxID=1813677 RepID=UPI0007BB949D|nr:TetR/AcrR family transcriptional regulator [Rhodococcus sp. EPR-157]KZF05548.1 TetR family transcriptional regulator [Rhodococcus sp. EPR-157]